MTLDEPRQARLVCVVARRGRFLIADRLFEHASPLVVGKRGSVTAEEGDLVVVEQEGGRARIVERLGRPDDVSAVLRGLVIESGLSPEHPEGAEREADAVAREAIGLDDGRDDLRHLVAVTVDPPDARDFDDALSAVREGDGVRVWVHVADVSSYVRPGGELDLEARLRALSVYVPGHVVPMLPHALSSGACSLQPGQDRRAVTVEAVVDAEGRVGEAIVRRSLIRSRARLTYEEAHEMLAGKLPGGEAGETLELTARVADLLRARRLARGALQVDAREVQIAIDGPDVIDARITGEPRAHQLVEELMLLANEAVARALRDGRLPALYRVHEDPEPSSIERLVAAFEALGVPTVPLPDPLTPQAAREAAARQSELLQVALRTREGGGIALKSLLLRSLQQAHYEPRNLGHAGLASDCYCHFTSPIRRYPDIVCHRSSGGEKVPVAGLEALGEHCSVAERAAADVERRADDVCLAWLLNSRLIGLGPDHVFEGEIVGLIGAGLFVRFGEVFEGFLPSRLLAGGDRFDPDELGIALVGRGSGLRFRLGDPLAVVVTEVASLLGRVTLDLAGSQTREGRPVAPARGRKDRRRQPRPTPRRGRRR